jgi:hypothetical protein
MKAGKQMGIVCRNDPLWDENNAIVIGKKGINTLVSRLNAVNILIGTIQASLS